MTEEMKNEMEQRESAEQNQQDIPLLHVQKELMQCKERYAYLMSDFENYRRREIIEAGNRTRRAEAAILLDILPIVDNFERALKDPQTSNLQHQLMGFELIYKNLVKLLEKYGVTEITTNEEFNPEYHEALAYVQQEGKASGSVVEVLQKGYRFKGEVLRPAQVSVAQ